jgi:lipopolysaccharide/colanic/teichoic acid biosynthesis glycosyltransferase
MYEPWRRAVEVALAGVLLALTAPLVLVAIVLVKLTSRGPCFYSQTRVGRHGRHFQIYKIRSMSHNCESQTGPRWATARDPRVTPVGRFLRKSHIDELPQLWNVLRGDMSLIGPRPERPEFVSQLERALLRYRDRLQVRPGITGLAQVQLPPDTDLTSVGRKLVCDLYYVQRLGPVLDLQILLGTASKLLGIPFGLTSRVVGIPSIDSMDCVCESSPAPVDEALVTTT